MFPSITCLCPTYGRPRLLANAIACFLAQDYPRNRCRLVILDDLGTIRGLTIREWTDAALPDWQDEAIINVENVTIHSHRQRYASLPEKYNALWRLAPPSDLYLVWEDDDAQLPWCLSSHAKACEQYGWSHPSHVWSDYGETGGLHTEPIGGRFHGALGIRGDTLTKLGGWPLTKRADFDQQFISRLREVVGKPGDPLDYCPSDSGQSPTGMGWITATKPPYIFRWATGQTHGQSTMRSPDDESWYDRYDPPDRSGPHTIIPAFDDDTKRFYELLTR